MLKDLGVGEAASQHQQQQQPASGAEGPLSHGPYGSTSTAECVSDAEAKLKSLGVGGAATRHGRPNLEEQLAEIARLNPPRMNLHQQPDASVQMTQPPSGIAPPGPAGSCAPQFAQPPVMMLPVMMLPAHPHAFAQFNPQPPLCGPAAASTEYVPPKTPPKQATCHGWSRHGSDNRTAEHQTVKKQRMKPQCYAKSKKSPPPAPEEDWQRRIKTRQEAVTSMKNNPIYTENQHVPRRDRPRTPDHTDRAKSKRAWEADVSAWRAMWRRRAGVAYFVAMGVSKKDCEDAWDEALRRIKASSECFENSEEFFDEHRRAATIILFGP